MEIDPRVWRKCSTCKKEILYGQPYQVCSVSGCRTHATNYAFCSVLCWDGHIPIERHRSESVSAIEKRAPRREEVLQQKSEAPAPAPAKRILVASPEKDTDEILVVVSKVKKYISDKSGMNTSAGVYKILTEKIKRICDQSIEEAKRNSRKTVLDRDVP